MTDVFGLGRDELVARAKEILPGAAGIAEPLFRSLYHKGIWDPASFGISARNAEAWDATFSPRWLAPVEAHEEAGESGITKKAALACADGSVIECVLIPMHDEAGAGAGAGIPDPRGSLCVSSQVGCRMGCAFCQTGTMGLSRDLDAGEIVAQVMTARFKLGWDFRNIVFMGMGEPLDNVDNLVRALRVLSEQSGAHFNAERMTVCTSGLLPGIAALARAGFKRLNLSISLNSGDDETRKRLMPVHPGMDRLADALAAYPMRKNFVLGVNYCLLPGINDGREDARRAATFCARAGRCLVNVIPYNPGQSPIARAPEEEEIDRFIGWLKEEGLPVRRRATKGRSIMAACGQLGRGAQK